MTIMHYNYVTSPELQASIVEPILLSCINGSTIDNLRLIIQKTLSISFNNLKSYLFCLIDYEIISYNGQKRLFMVEDDGFSLLEMIEKEKIQKGISIEDILITFECI